MFPPPRRPKAETDNKIWTVRGKNWRNPLSFQGSAHYSCSHLWFYSWSVWLAQIFSGCLCLKGTVEVGLTQSQSLSKIQKTQTFQNIAVKKHNKTVTFSKTDHRDDSRFLQATEIVSNHSTITANNNRAFTTWYMCAELGRSLTHCSSLLITDDNSDVIEVNPFMSCILMNLFESFH